MRIPIREITTDSDPALSGFLELYVESFHAWGREPVAELVEQIRSGSDAKSGLNYRCWVAVSGDAVVGLIRGAALPNTQCGYVVHIATAPGARRLGIGRSLLEVAEKGFLEQLSCPLGTLFECERIEDAENDDDLEVKKQRLAFFQSLGTVKIAPDYTQPELAPYLPSMSLNLLLKPAREDFDPKELVERFYSEVFGLNRGNGYVDKALETAGAMVL